MLILRILYSGQKSQFLSIRSVLWTKKHAKKWVFGPGARDAPPDPVVGWEGSRDTHSQTSPPHTYAHGLLLGTYSLYNRSIAALIVTWPSARLSIVQVNRVRTAVYRLTTAVLQANLTRVGGRYTMVICYCPSSVRFLFSATCVSDGQTDGQTSCSWVTSMTSVRLSVCPSVTLVNCDHKAQFTANILIPHERVVWHHWHHCWCQKTRVIAL